MSVLIAVADGNLTAAATWALADSTSLLHAENANTALTTAYVESQTFTPGAITIDGIAVKVATRASSPSGAMSVRLAQGGATVAGTEVTVNVSDIQGTAAGAIGWFFVRFAAPVTLVALTAYTVSAKTSAAAQVNLYRNATGGNWSRMLRTTTTQAPVAGDVMFIAGEWTAAATKDDRTVTMNETASTDYGDGSTSLASLGISNGGRLVWGTAPATNYVLRLSGNLDVWTGGILQMGTTGTPCPDDSTQQLEFDCAADGDFGLRAWATWTGQGPPPLAGVTNHYALLNADAAAAATNLTTDRQLSAKSGDDIAIASTTRTSTQAETRTLNADAGATSLSVSAGLTNAHGGTSPVQAEVISLSRRVRVRSVSTTAMAYVSLNDGCSVDLDWVEFRYLGAGTTGKRGVELTAGNAAVNINKCSFRNFDNHGFYAGKSGGVAEFTLTDNVFYDLGASGAAIYINEATPNGWTITGNVGVVLKSAYGIRLNDVGGTLQNNRMTSCGQDGYLLSEAAFISGTISGNVAHACGGSGMTITNCYGGTLADLTLWRNTQYGLNLNGAVGDILWNTLSVFGNGTAGINSGSSSMGAMTFRSASLNGDTTFAQPRGFNCSSANPSRDLRFEACSFGVASGILTTHSSGDIDMGGSAAFTTITLVKTTLASATEWLNKASLVGRAAIRYQRHEDVALAHKVEYPALGTVERDDATYRTNAPSVKLAPIAAVSTFRLESEDKIVRLLSGQTLTINAYVRKDASYTGSAPRLRVRANVAAGVSEATLDTLSVAAGTWEQLTGAVGPVAEDCFVRVYVDADGSAGQVNVDDWSRSIT